MVACGEIVNTAEIENQQILLSTAPSAGRKNDSLNDPLQ